MTVRRSGRGRAVLVISASLKKPSHDSDESNYKRERYAPPAATCMRGSDLRRGLIKALVLVEAHGARCDRELAGEFGDAISAMRVAGAGLLAVEAPERDADGIGKCQR